MRKIILGITAFCFILVINACSDKTNARMADITPITVRIAIGNGIPYAPFYIMENKGLIQKHLGDKTKLNLSILGTSSMNEALVSNRLDFAVMGSPNAFVAWDKGIKIKIFSGIVTGVNALQVRNGIKNLSDFTSADKIAVPSLGSIQQLILAIAAEKELGDAHALDNNLVGMAHPDAAMTLITGSIAAHFTNFPYIAQENNAGFNTILTLSEAFGGDISTLVLVSEKFLTVNPLAVLGVFAALSEAICLINQRDPEALAIIAEVEKITFEEVEKYLNWEGVNYTSTLYGLEGMIDFMHKEGFISKKPTLEDILWEPALAAIGKRSGAPGILEEAQKRK
jgi:NitT/TauT family transport system substrate-binding protein